MTSGSIHDINLLKEFTFRKILGKIIKLGDFGEIPLLTIGNSAFSQYSWLIKRYN